MIRNAADGLFTKVSRDITGDIPSVTTNHFVNFSISATNEGGVIISRLYGSSVWIYHSPLVELDLSGNGVTSIGGVGGCYFQSDYPCSADCNIDGKVDLSDLVIMKGEFGRDDCDINPCQSDCNYDYNINLSDLVIMKNEFLIDGCDINYCQADSNGDSKVDLSDLVIMKNQFLRSDCPVHS